MTVNGRHTLERVSSDPVRCLSWGFWENQALTDYKISRLATFDATDIAFKCTIARRKEKRCLKCKHKKEKQNETTTQLFLTKTPLGGFPHPEKLKLKRRAWNVGPPMLSGIQKQLQSEVITGNQRAAGDGLRALSESLLALLTIPGFWRDDWNHCPYPSAVHYARKLHGRKKNRTREVQFSSDSPL